MSALKKLYSKHFQLLREAADGLDGPSLGRHGIGNNDSGEFWGSRGAGIMPVCSATGKVMLVLRSQMVNEPGTWGIPGGAIDGSESFEVAAARELKEELSYGGPVDIHTAFQFKKGTFTFQNFFGVVPEEFEAHLDWENEDYGWFSLEELPSPLHFGTKALLSNSMGLLKGLLNVVEDSETMKESYERWMRII